MTTRKRYYIKINSEYCKGCGLCLEVCPKNVLALGTAMNSRGQHTAHPANAGECIGCLQCADICPDTAIEIDEEQS